MITRKGSIIRIHECAKMNMNLKTTNSKNNKRNYQKKEKKYIYN